MSLPLSRNTTYSAGVSPVKANDLNALQDCIVGGKRGAYTRWFPPRSREENNQGTITFTNGMVFAGANASAINYVSAPLEEGDQILGLKASVKGTGAAGNVVVTLARWRDGVQTVQQTLTIVDPPNSWAIYSLAFAGLTVVAGDAFWLGASFALTNQGITSFGLDLARP